MRKRELEEELQAAEAEKSRLRTKVEQLKFGPSDFEMKLKGQLRDTRQALVEAEAVIRELTEWAERYTSAPNSIAGQEFQSIISAPRKTILRLQREAREKSNVNSI